MSSRCHGSSADALEWVVPAAWVPDGGRAEAATRPVPAPAVARRAPRRPGAGCRARCRSAAGEPPRGRQSPRPTVRTGRAYLDIAALAWLGALAVAFDTIISTSIGCLDGNAAVSSRFPRVEAGSHVNSKRQSTTIATLGVAALALGLAACGDSNGSAGGDGEI